MTLDYIITLDYRQNEPFTRQKILGGRGKRSLLQGEGSTWLRRGEERVSDVIMYNTRLVGAIVMTSSTLWPWITPWGASSPVRVLGFLHETDWSPAGVSFPFFVFSHLGPSLKPLVTHKTHPASSSHGQWSHAGAVSDLNETGLVQLSAWFPADFKVCVWNGPPLQGHTENGFQ